MAIEKEFGIDIPNHDAEACKFSWRRKRTIQLEADPQIFRFIGSLAYPADVCFEFPRNAKRRQSSRLASKSPLPAEVNPVNFPESSRWNAIQTLKAGK